MVTLGLKGRWIIEISTISTHHRNNHVSQKSVCVDKSQTQICFAAWRRRVTALYGAVTIWRQKGHQLAWPILAPPLRTLAPDPPILGGILPTGGTFGNTDATSAESHAILWVMTSRLCWDVGPKHRTQCRPNCLGSGRAAAWAIPFQHPQDEKWRIQKRKRFFTNRPLVQYPLGGVCTY